MKKSLTNGQKKEFSTFDFFENFPTDEKCLEHYMSLNWPPGTTCTEREFELQTL